MKTKKSCLSNGGLMNNIIYRFYIISKKNLAKYLNKRSVFHVSGDSLKKFLTEFNMKHGINQLQARKEVNK